MIRDNRSLVVMATQGLELLVSNKEKKKLKEPLLRTAAELKDLIDFV